MTLDTISVLVTRYNKIALDSYHDYPSRSLVSQYKYSFTRTVFGIGYTSRIWNLNVNLVILRSILVLTSSLTVRLASRILPLFNKGSKVFYFIIVTR